MILSFDRFELNTETYELRRDGEIRPVEPLVFDLIAHLAAHPGLVLGRDQLVEAVWKGRSVADATIATCVKNARRALDDTGRSQTLIRTVRRRGFTFTAEVTRKDEGHGRAPGSAEAEPRAASRELDPSLLLTPFRCESEDPAVLRVTTSLATSLGTILTRVPLLRLITRSDRSTDLEGPSAAHRFRAEPGVDWVVDGAVQDLGGGLRANVALTNARTGARIWAEAFPLPDRRSETVDDCVAAIIGKLEPQIHRAMYRSVRSRDGEPTARQWFLQAHGLLVEQGWNADSFSEAKQLLHRSVELDPELALAPALLALLTGMGARVGVETDAEAARGETLDAAERALRLDSLDSNVLGYAGCALADVGQLDRAESILRNAIDLNPANAQALVSLGTVCWSRDDLHQAIELFARGIRISPLDPRLSVWGAFHAAALLRAGDVEGALVAAQTACRRSDRTYLPRVAMAAVRLVQGDTAAAAAALADARRAMPTLAPQQLGALVGRQLCKRLLEL
jgi:DNA-binding winged helix-turn-helix (wHTH) protein/tetratricopeptide (TPR) repeat protein